MNDDQMKDLAREVAFVREIVAELNADEAGIKAVLEASELYEKYLAARSERIFYGNLLATIENAFREIAVQYWQATGSKKVPGGGVRENPVMKYDDDQAIAWAAKHHIPALRLNAKVFEKAAKGMDLPFVTIEKVPSGTINSDLSEFLENEPPDLDA